MKNTQTALIDTKIELCQRLTLVSAWDHKLSKIKFQTVVFFALVTKFQVDFGEQLVERMPNIILELSLVIEYMFFL